jgi:PAS domain S-box-containing protein
VAEGTVDPSSDAASAQRAEVSLSAGSANHAAIAATRGFDEAKEFFRAAFDAAPDPLVVATLDGTLVDVNAKASEMLGYSREELIGMHPSNLLWDEDPSRLEHDLRSVQEGTAYQGDWKIKRKDGSTFDGEVLSRRLMHDKLIGMLRNVTEQKRAEQARKTLEHQLLQAQKVQALGTLAGGIAHDFNNILSAIIGNVEIALQDLEPHHPAQVSVLEIRKASRRARDLVRQILIFSRQQADERRVTQLRDVIEESVAMLRAALPAGVTLHVQCDPDTPPVLANRTQLMQVLMNLCVNAWQAMEGHDGRIEVSLAGVIPVGDEVCPELPAGRCVRLRVQDNGKGMDSATLEHVFDPFFTTKEPGAGTGLGLPVVERVVRSHHGAIRLKSAPGAGTTFDLYFPCASGDIEPSSDEAPQPQRGEHQRVLYVDDEEPLVSLGARFLSGLGYQVKGCTRAEDALAAFSVDPMAYDLLVTDLNMPGMSGLDLAERCLNVRKDFPVALVSGYVSDELQAKALALGVREVIYKPNLVEELAQSIHRLLSELR